MGERKRPKNLPQHATSSNLSFDEHRAQTLDLSQTLVNRWQEIAARELTASRRKRLHADLTAWEDVTSTLRNLLPEAACDSATNDEAQKVYAEFELLKARMNGVPV